MSRFTAKDGTGIYYKEWGTGPAVVFCHGWPLSSDSWESQMLFLAGKGLRCIAHDRRGHGRSDQPWDGNEMDTYADDLAALIDHLGLKRFDMPTLVIHGDDDQIVPIGAAGRASVQLIRDARLIVYPGAPHGLTDTHKDRLNTDLLAFLQS